MVSFSLPRYSKTLTQVLSLLRLLLLDLSSIFFDFSLIVSRTSSCNERRKIEGRYVQYADSIIDFFEFSSILRFLLVVVDSRISLIFRRFSDLFEFSLILT